MRNLHELMYCSCPFFFCKLFSLYGSLVSVILIVGYLDWCELMNVDLADAPSFISSGS